jgi:nitrogenase iron protein NifH
MGIRQIAIYGKGGCGKSTVASNLAVALAEMGHKVMQVGCSPKADSTYYLLGGSFVPTILDQIRSKGMSFDAVKDCFREGYMGVVCAEAGGPEPASGCAGRGVLLALDLIRKYEIPAKFGVDFVIYDVIADVVCGGFSQPMRAGYAREIYIVSTGELMALYSTNNIVSAIEAMKKLKGTDIKLGGVIDNQRGIPNEDKMVEEFCSKINAPVIAHIPRSPLVQRAEAKKGTVMQYFPDSDIANKFRELARYVESPKFVEPNPFDPRESIQVIGTLLRKYKIFV